MRVLLLVLLLLIVSPAQAASEDTPQNRLALSERLVELQWPDQINTLNEMRAGFAATLPPEMREGFQRGFDAALDLDEMRRLIVTMMARHMTTAELEALIGFYSSPAGRGVMAKMGIMMRESAPMQMQIILNALRKLPAEQRPPQFRSL